MKYKNLFAAIFVFLSATIFSQVEFKIDLTHTGNAISPLLYGIFFEDINHAADGGLYAELIRNRSFEDNAQTPLDWNLVKQGNATGTISLDTSALLNIYQKHALKIEVTSTTDERLGVANGGFWGINVVNGRRYSLTLFAKCSNGFDGTLDVSLENSDGSVIYAKDTIVGLTTEWQKLSATLTANNSDPKGRLVLTTKNTGTIWLDVVSLFPPTFKDRPNGLRPDLAQMLADIKPKFMRFPGGCFVEGDSMVNAFRWKTTIGPIENRPGHKNFWSYRTSDGMGFHEFLQLSEDLGSEPLYVTNCGMSHTTLVPLNAELDSLIQELLDAIEYANGSISTQYGALRAANGHPEPFNLKYIEIGNENNFNQVNYEPRYARFYKAIKQQYPDMNCIADSYVGTAKTDIIDEHYYSNPQFFLERANLYDSYNRSAQKIYVGEYAVTSGCGKGNMIAALGEAVFMTGFERNSDVVRMASYAPIFVNNNDRNWNPDIINFDAANSYGTPSYYVQNLFSNNIGDFYIPATEKNNLIAETISGKIGVATWATQAQFDDVDVLVNGSSILSDDFSSSSGNWTASSGTWTTADGVYKQSSNATDCRANYKTTISDTAYTYSLRAKKTGGSEGFLIIFGYKDKSNFYWWNIGGWGNTKHAIEKCINGSKSTIASINGKINSNQWYNIKITISKGLVQCFIDDVLIQQFEESSKNLYISSTLQLASNELITKIVNPYGTAMNSDITLNVNTTDTHISGSATILSSSSATAENSFANPTRIIPETSSIVDLPLNFQYNFPAYSLTILRLQIPNMIVGIENGGKQVQKSQIIVYPNPVKDKLFLTNAADLKTLSIYDLTGREVLRDIQPNETQTINTSGLCNGIYFIKGSTEKSSFKATFIKN